MKVEIFLQPLPIIQGNLGFTFFEAILYCLNIKNIKKIKRRSFSHTTNTLRELWRQKASRHTAATLNFSLSLTKTVLEKL